MAFVILTFLVVAIVISICVTAYRDALESVTGQELALALPQIEEKRTYKPAMHAQVLSKGHRGCIGTIESSDGIIYSWSRISYRSHKGATRELNSELAQAVEIVKRGALFDESGKIVGDEVIATFAVDEGPSYISAKVLWTRGADFGDVASSSIKNILTYLEDHQR